MNPKYSHRIGLALVFLSSLLLVGLYAEGPRSKPGPEQERLKVWVGNWTYHGTAHATPTGKAGTFSGTVKSRMILGGRFLESRGRDKSNVGDDKGKITEGVEITGYDPVKKAYTAFGFDSDGSTSEASLTVDGNTWTQLTTSTGPESLGYTGRMVTTFSADGKKATVKVDISRDGQVWVPRYDFVLRRR